MNKTKIEWCNYTINPIIGCKNNCWYCYGKRLNDRFKWIPDWIHPQLQKNWLNKLQLIKKPSVIFMGSMSDLFGKWVLDEDIWWIISCCEEFQQHKFLFLTKNPERYASFEFPSNCLLGATITCSKDLWRVDVMRNIGGFISIEPLLEDVSAIPFRGIKWLIIGALTGPNAKKFIPKKEWVESILEEANKYKIPVFMKNNLKWQDNLRQEFLEEILKI